MPPSEVPDLIGLLTETLEQLQQIEDIHPDDPTLLELKRNIVLIVAQLRIMQEERDVAA
jgi:hypothetical protein